MCLQKIPAGAREIASTARLAPVEVVAHHNELPPSLTAVRTRDIDFAIVFRLTAHLLSAIPPVDWVLVKQILGIRVPLGVDKTHEAIRSHRVIITSVPADHTWWPGSVSLDESEASLLHSAFTATVVSHLLSASGHCHQRWDARCVLFTHRVLLHR